VLPDDLIAVVFEFRAAGKRPQNAWHTYAKRARNAAKARNIEEENAS
jgi:hypothetical protein